MINNGWTPERRLRQSQKIHKWKPWKLAGVKTKEGKSVSKMNAIKHGCFTAEIRNTHKQLAEHKRVLKNILNLT